MKSIQVEVAELEHCLLGPDDVDICIKSLAEGTRHDCGGNVADTVGYISGADHLWTA